MSFDEQRDQYGNLSSPSYSSDEAWNAGARQWDQKWEVDYKVEQARKEQLSKMLASWDTSSQSTSTGPVYTGSGDYGTGTGAGLGGCLLVLVATVFVLVSGVLALEHFGPQLEHMPTPRQWIERYLNERTATTRRTAYSDFAAPSAWPDNVQRMVQSGGDVPLDRLLEDLPPKLQKLSPARQTELGAQVWFKLASHGKDAFATLLAIQEAPHRRPSPFLTARILAMTFLKRQCRQGVEVACLDAAKAVAGLTFDQFYGNDKALDDAALDELPKSGPLAEADRIVALRGRLQRHE